MAADQPASGDLEITLSSLDSRNLGSLKLLNSVVFPIKYPEQVYKDCLLFPELSLLAHHGPTLVGGIMARLERRKAQEGSCSPLEGARLYIASLGVLAPYRGYKVGSKLLARCLAGVADEPEVVEAVVHMQVGNEDVQRFYERHGFKVADTVPNYYRALDPPDALMLVRPQHQ